VISGAQLRLHSLAQHLFTGKTAHQAASRRCSATATPGSAKYGPQAAPSINIPHFGLSEKAQRELQVAASHSITARTWQSYRTAERMLKRFLLQRKERLELPLKEETVLGFVHWLAFEKGLKATSISGYLAGIKKLHLIKGAPEPKLRSELINMILEGKKNMDAQARLQNPSSERQPVTVDVMKLLKVQLVSWDSSEANKATAWLICSLLFHGACRGGELLCKTANCFDPNVNLLRRDVQYSDKSSEAVGAVISLKLKNPKESKDNRAAIVDIYETKSAICPVKAFKKWSRLVGSTQQDGPAFCWDNGKPVTCNAMNSIIKGRLDQFIPGHKISVHSFRTGTASMMAELGYSDQDIKSIGRWSSRAFENYIKLPRSKRIQTLEKLKENKSW